MNHIGKTMMMQAEMARFENEISGSGGRMEQQHVMPPRYPPSNMSLRFVPHSLLRPPGGAAFPPPPSFSLHPALRLNRPMGGVAIPPPQPFGFPGMRPPAPPPPGAAAEGPVIEAPPTKYGNKPAEMAPISHAHSTQKEAYKLKSENNSTSNKPSSSTAVQQSAYTTIPDQTSLKQTKNPKNSKSGPPAKTPFTPKLLLRTAGGETWKDDTLAEWDPNDYRVFCGDLGNEVSDELLAKAFRKYTSFQKAKVIRDKRTNKTKGFGFVSFKDPQDFIRAIREMDGKYVGNRPIKLKKSAWKDRSLGSVRKKEKEKKKLGMK